MNVVRATEARGRSADDTDDGASHYPRLSPSLARDLKKWRDLCLRAFSFFLSFEMFRLAMLDDRITDL